MAASLRSGIARDRYLIRCCFSIGVPAVVLQEAERTEMESEFKGCKEAKSKFFAGPRPRRHPRN